MTMQEQPIEPNTLVTDPDEEGEVDPAAPDPADEPVEGAEDLPDDVAEGDASEGEEEEKED